MPYQPNIIAIQFDPVLYTDTLPQRDNARSTQHCTCTKFYLQICRFGEVKILLLGSRQHHLQRARASHYL